MKIETHFARVTVDIIDDKPYYHILFFDPRDGEYHMGFGSYKIENTFEWLRENFEINCGGCDDPTFRLKEELKIRCAEIEDIKRNLSAVLDERSKIGLEFEQALKRIDELNGKIEFYKGQIDAYQYCMNCRR